jgi:hypothetical protein
MLDLSSLGWCQPVLAAPELMSESTAQDNLASANEHLNKKEISLGEAFPTAAEKMRTRKRLPLLWAILQSGIWLDYLTGVKRFATDMARFGIEATIARWRVNELEGNNMKELFPLDFANFKRLSTIEQTMVFTVHKIWKYLSPTARYSKRGLRMLESVAQIQAGFQRV